VDTEIILIHPFSRRKWKDSTALAILMALHAGLPLLDFSGFEKERQKEYFVVIQHGLERNDEPMIKDFTDCYCSFVSGL
jgi:hypothetical protein